MNLPPLPQPEVVGTAPTVSVIMPVLNAAKYFRESVESVLQQTLGSWELLLIDDGSTDESPRIAAEYQSQEPERVRLLTHPGSAQRGASATRNLGISEARGRYLALLDADDVWLPRKLEQQVAILDTLPEAGMLYGNTLYWYSWSENGRGEDTDFLPPLGVRPNELLPVPKLLELTLSGLAAVPCTCSVLMRSEVVRRTGGFEEEFRLVYTDQTFYAKMFLEAPVYPTTTVWDKYRRHSESSCSTAEATGEMNDARVAYLRWLARYLSERGFEGSDVWNALQRELRLVGASPARQRTRRFTTKVRRRIRGWLGGTDD